MVPTARFELAHLAALAPQASVSTSSTTSALYEILSDFYLGAGAVGAGALAGALGACVAGRSVVTGGAVETGGAVVAAGAAGVAG